MGEHVLVYKLVVLVALEFVNMETPSVGIFVGPRFRQLSFVYAFDTFLARILGFFAISCRIDPRRFVNFVGSLRNGERYIIDFGSVKKWSFLSLNLRLVWMFKFLLDIFSTGA